VILDSFWVEDCRLVIYFRLVDWRLALTVSRDRTRKSLNKSTISVMPIRRKISSMMPSSSFWLYTLRPECSRRRGLAIGGEEAPPFLSRGIRGDPLEQLALFRHRFLDPLQRLLQVRLLLDLRHGSS
jgi:hypothetical protein